MQNFVIDGGGTINGLTFQDATAGSNVTYNIMGGTVLAFNGTSTAGDATFICDNIGSDFFTDSASAGNATFTRNGTAPLTFYGGSSAASGTFTLNAPGTAGTGPASIDFVGGSAANATFTINGTGSGNSNEVFIGPFSAGAVAAHFTANGAIDSNHFPGLVVLEANPGRSILIANAGSGGGSGGLLTWDTTGGNGARVEVFGNGTGDATNGTLDISSTGHGVNVPIGSLEGTGLVELADDKLTVGSNNLSTIFGGIIQDAGGGTNGSGSLTKTGTGTFTLASANTYTGSTTVSAGTLLVTNRNGSATGTGHVTVNGGVVGGTGKISGAVTIGSTTRFGTIAPGLVGRAGKLTTLSAITFNLFGIYNADIDSVRTAADQVVATGVTIGSGATINLSDLGNAVLTSGTVFTIINNKAAVPISGRFSNLADGSTMTVGSNTYRVSYEGGTGNDLTLTVQ
jgi:autotransporter-associated beta strand protein